jgi:hypothetical protein
MKLPVNEKQPVVPVPGTKITGGFLPYVKVLGMWMAARSLDSVRE